MIQKVLKNRLSTGGKIFLRQIFSNKPLKPAFTLAEVLITLGIIGVVAALTMPSLIANIQDKILESQAKKARNRVANGYKLMMARDEIFKVQNIQFFSCGDHMGDVNCVSRIHKENFQVLNDSASGLNASLMPEEYAIAGQQESSPFKWENVEYMFRTGDGMIYGVIPNDELTSFDVIVDVNGKNRPNIAAKDLRKYRFSGEGGQAYDVSEELTQTSSSCSIDNLDECTTFELCASVSTEYAYGSYMGTVWTGSQCVIHYYE